MSEQYKVKRIEQDLLKDESLERKMDSLGVESSSEELFNKERGQKKQAFNTYLRSIKVRECPNCGFKVDLADDDCIYPMTRDRTKWNLVCYQTGGGCDSHVEGSSVEEVIEKWNAGVHLIQN